MNVNSNNPRGCIHIPLKDGNLFSVSLPVRLTSIYGSMRVAMTIPSVRKDYSSLC